MRPNSDSIPSLQFFLIDSSLTRLLWIDSSHESGTVLLTAAVLCAGLWGLGVKVAHGSYAGHARHISSETGRKE